MPAGAVGTSWAGTAWPATCWNAGAWADGAAVYQFPADMFGTAQSMPRRRRRVSFDGAFGDRIMPGTREGRLLFNMVEGTTAPLDPIRLWVEDAPINLTGIDVEAVIHDNAGNLVTVAGAQVEVDPDQTWDPVTKTGGRGQLVFTPAANQFANSLTPYRLRWKLTDGAGQIQFVPDAGADRFDVFAL